MKLISALTLALCIVSPALSAAPMKRKGGGNDGGSGGKGGGGNGGSGGKGGGSGATAANGIPLKANAKNQVCVPWYDVRDAIMGGIYHGRCNDLARASIRLAFHDAGTFSLALQAAGKPNGGADGSMLTDPDEVKRSDNNGLQDIVAALIPLVSQFNVPPGDLLHLAGNLGVLACPGGPQVNTYVGRASPKNIAPTGLLPSPNSPVSVLLARFTDMGFTSRDMVALAGAHSTGKQRFQDTSRAGASFDTTVDVWDVRFYRETQQNASTPGVFRLASDVNFSRDKSTVSNFNRYIGNQNDWAEDYAKAHEKMSLLGFNKNTLTDCTEIMPTAIDLKNLAITTSSSGKGGNGGSDPTIDRTKLEAAIQNQRSIWL